MFTRTLTRLATTGLVAGALVAVPSATALAVPARDASGTVVSPSGATTVNASGNVTNGTDVAAPDQQNPIPAAPAAQPVPQPPTWPENPQPLPAPTARVGEHGHGLPVGRRRHRRGRRARDRPRRAGLHGPRPAPGHARRRARRVGVLALVPAGRRSLCGRRPAVRGAPRGVGGGSSRWRTARRWKGGCRRRWRPARASAEAHRAGGRLGDGREGAGVGGCSAVGRPFGERAEFHRSCRWFSAQRRRRDEKGTSCVPNSSRPGRVPESVVALETRSTFAPYIGVNVDRTASAPPKHRGRAAGAGSTSPRCAVHRRPRDRGAHRAWRAEQERAASAGRRPSPPAGATPRRAR